MELILQPTTLKLKDPFRIAHGSRVVQETLIVALKEDEQVGYGEAVASPYYHVSVQDSMEALEAVRERLREGHWKQPEAFWASMKPFFAHNPFALCGLDNAFYDLWAQKQGKPLHAIWQLDPARAPLSNYTLGIDSIEGMIRKMKAQPWPVYKIKLGTEADLDIVRALRKHTRATFRVDANCAWTAEQTLAMAPELKRLGVEFIEQPLQADDWDGMKEVYAHSPLPILADESCIAEEDVARCAPYFHGINIKLTKCGGLSPGRRMVQQARKLGLSVMVGCMTESSVGISAIGQLAPLLDYVDMDSMLLITNDPASGVRLEAGKLRYPDRPGLGIEWKG